MQEKENAAQNCRSGKRGKVTYMFACKSQLLRLAAVRKRIEISQFRFQKFNRMNFSTLCTILVAFGPENSEFMLLTIAPFAAIRQKSAYHAKYLRINGPILTYFTGLVDVLVGMIFQIFGLQSPKGRCYGNQLNLGDVHKRSVERPLLVASAFDKGLADRKSALKTFNGNNQAT